ncbi:MAG: TPM domain-containing protein [Ruminococcus sp.]|nr:TPM domain-containing protein [Ruminococcus sp.]
MAATFFSVMFLAIPSSAAKSVIDDMAGLYSSSELAELEEKQQAVSDKTGWNIAVVTTNVGFGEDGAEAMRYAEDYYDMAFGSTSSSVVYLIDLDYRHFAMDGDLLNYFNTSRLDRLIDKCEEEYFDYDDVGNLETFYYYLEYYYDQGTVQRDPNIGVKGEGFVPDDNRDSEDEAVALVMFLSGIIAGIAAAAIGIGIVLSRYKFHHAPTANCYLNSNTINMYRRQDRFVREYTTRTRIDSDSGGGGGHSGGGHSHGGSHHGGGGHGGRR